MPAARESLNPAGGHHDPDAWPLGKGLRPQPTIITRDDFPSAGGPMPTLILAAFLTVAFQVEGSASARPNYLSIRSSRFSNRWKTSDANTKGHCAREVKSRRQCESARTRSTTHTVACSSGRRGGIIISKALHRQANDNRMKLARQPSSGRKRNTAEQYTAVNDASLGSATIKSRREFLTWFSNWE